VYACQLSADQTLLFTANRDKSHYGLRLPSLKRRLRIQLPDLQEYDKSLSSLADPRLGLHHSYLVSLAAPKGTNDVTARKQGSASAAAAASSETVSKVADLTREAIESQTG